MILLLLSLLPIDTATRETVDQLEVSHVYHWSQITHENGDTDFELKPVFTQLLFRRWNGTDHVIEAWRMQKPGMQPTYSHALGCHELRWIDQGKERVIRARTLSESSADYDPELTERTELPREMRRELR